jgi:hypothetical protein
MKNAPPVPACGRDKARFDLFVGWRWPLATLALLVFAFFSRFLLTGRFFLMRDLICDFYARKKFYKIHLLQGELPLWNPYNGGGEPFLSNMESAVFYPPNLLNLLFTVPTANVILVTLHVFLAGFGVWLACRAWRISQQGSLLAAISFAFGTQMVTRIEFSSFHCSLSWYPLAVALFTLWLKQPSLRKFLLLALLFSLQFLGGYPEAVLFTAGTLVIYALVVGSRSRLAGKKRLNGAGLALLGLAGMGVIAIMLSLAQILPVLTILPLSIRAVQEPLANEASVNPVMWLSALFPYLYGVPGHFGRYWAPACWEFWLGTFYVGLLPVMLCVTVLIRSALGWRKEPADLTSDPAVGLRTTFLVVLLIFSMLYAMGAYTPFFGFLWHVFPPLHWFRWPAKALMVVSFALSCLGGIALDWLANQGDVRGQQSSAWRKRLANYGPVALWLSLAALAGACLADAGGLLPWILRSYFNLGAVAEKYSHNIPWKTLNNDLLKFSLVAVFSTILIQLYILKRERRRVIFIVMMLVLFSDLMITTYPLLPSSDMNIMSNTGELDDLFRSGKLKGRIYRQTPNAISLYGVTNEKLLRQSRNSMVGYWSLVDKVPKVFPVGDFKLQNYMDLISYDDDSIPELHKTKILQIIGAAYFLETPLQPEYFTKKRINTPKLYPLEDATPAAVVVGHAVGFATWDDLLHALVSGNYDLSKVALLESADLTQIGHLDDTGLIKHEIIDYANRLNGLTVKVRSAKQGLLVINATYYPRWVAKVNGIETPIYQANGPFRAVVIPAGDSVVEMDYHPQNTIIGLYLSLGCLTLVLVAFFMADRITMGRRTQKKSPE